jgi:hypothetical protein
VGTVNVSAVIVTRGNVDLRPVLDSLPPEWEQVVWNNGGTLDGGGATCCVMPPGRNGRGPIESCVETGPDVAVYGRYAAIEHASHEIIYVQDDDCIVSDPRAIAGVAAATRDLVVVCNMPEPWRSNPFYSDHALVGFGAAFHRDLPGRAFSQGHPDPLDTQPPSPLFLRTCDVVFTGLTDRVLVNVPHRSLDYAYGTDRMYQQATHQQERNEMLRLVRRVKGER